MCESWLTQQQLSVYLATQVTRGDCVTKIHSDTTYMTVKCILQRCKSGFLVFYNTKIFIVSYLSVTPLRAGIKSFTFTSIYMSREQIC
jgi:hypothetical protein